MFPNISPFSVSHSENTPRHMRLPEVLFTFFAVNTKRSIIVHGTTTHSLGGLCVVQHNRSITKALETYMVQQLGILVELIAVDALRNQTYY